MKPLVKLFTGTLLLIILGLAGKAQYYYKDLIVTRQTTAQWKLYKAGKVRTIKLSSFERDGSPSEGFQCDQEITANGSLITTHTRSVGTPESSIFANYSPAGLPTKIEDTSDTYRSVSEYQYDASDYLTSITNTSLETDNHVQEVEQHLWQYDPNTPGRPISMLKIRNANDTTFVRFVTDEKGHIAEEHATRNGVELPAIYYYYDDASRLTDIVRYNAKAQRLLPDYIFEYNATGELPASMLVVREGGSDYQKWIYQYNDKGLKIKEACFNKKKELLGKVEYEYK
jgi:YD repeat-containing protein